MPEALTREVLKEELEIFQRGLTQILVTKQHLDGRLEDLKFIFATKEDLENLSNEITNKFSTLQSSVDTYLHRTEQWHSELVVLKARHDKVSNSLVDKSILNKEETIL